MPEKVRSGIQHHYCVSDLRSLGSWRPTESSIQHWDSLLIFENDSTLRGLFVCYFLLLLLLLLLSLLPFINIFTKCQFKGISPLPPPLCSLSFTFIWSFISILTILTSFGVILRLLGIVISKCAGHLVQRNVFYIDTNFPLTKLWKKITVVKIWNMYKRTHNLKCCSHFTRKHLLIPKAKIKRIKTVQVMDYDLNNFDVVDSHYLHQLLSLSFALLLWQGEHNSKVWDN